MSILQKTLRDGLAEIFNCHLPTKGDVLCPLGQIHAAFLLFKEIHDTTDGNPHNMQTRIKSLLSMTKQCLSKAFFQMIPLHIKQYRRYSHVENLYWNMINDVK